MWGKAGKKVKAREAVQKTVASTLLQQYKKVKKDPEDFYNELLENNTTHFTPPELERLLAAFTRVTQDRLQVRIPRPPPPGLPLPHSASHRRRFPLHANFRWTICAEVPRAGRARGDQHSPSGATCLFGSLRGGPCSGRA